MKHSILCVDDEIDNVDALERLFRRKYNVLRATSGREALKILETERVALILSDQRMPGMTGVELLSAARESQPEAVRMLLTGYTDIESVISAINSGQIYRYITKPWDPVDLGNAIDKAIERFELAAELREKNLALETALTELRTLDEAKSNFMILINHELKTPLTAMLSFMDLLRETELDSDQTKYLKRIDQSAARLRQLIEDSLELVSAETGTLPIKPAKINLSKMGDELTTRFAPALAARRLKLECAWSENEARADQRAVASVLTRLLDNAIKFATEKTTLRLESQARGGDVEVTLSNQGQAIKAETIAKILKPFSLDENIMHHSKGTGLGLSIAQAVLKRMGTQLRVAVPKGEFKVSFVLPSGRR